MTILKWIDASHNGPLCPLWKIQQQSIQSSLIQIHNKPDHLPVYYTFHMAAFQIKKINLWYLLLYWINLKIVPLWGNIEEISKSVKNLNFIFFTITKSPDFFNIFSTFLLFLVCVMFGSFRVPWFVVCNFASLFIHTTQSSSSEVGSEFPDVNYSKSIPWWCFRLSAAQTWMAAILVTCSFACCSIHLEFYIRPSTQLTYFASYDVHTFSEPLATANIVLPCLL